MNDSQSLRGYLFAIGAYLMWGVFPLYWKAMDSVPAMEILAYRIACSFVFLLLFNLVLGRKEIFRYLKEPKTRLVLFITSSLISLNWGTYIWAVNAGHTVEASLGYYINPLVNVFLGMLIFNERMTPMKTVAIVLAFSGVLYQTVGYGNFPWTAMVLAFTFAFYGLFKKKYALDSINSLMAETLIITPVAVGYLLFDFLSGESGAVSAQPTVLVLLAFSGIATSVPLYLFGEGAKRIPFSSLGFLQYIGPTIMLLIGVFFFGEDFSGDHVVSFALIWTGLAVYAFSAVKEFRKKKKKEKVSVV
ncbi:putative transporter YojE [Fulvitalea axinellae]|uniref:Transporter YojE n=1 Tax=Fulvitalea axinellae TaxID=1182444 RepID=A0AAU9CTI2_9BACT|nr:putative transporter YojE [Fulvitalea axinellae]